MNILILTGKFGMGHYCAAEAVKQEILVNEPDANVDVIDIMDYMYPVLSSAIYGCFNFMVSKCSRVYNCLNHFAARSSAVPLKLAVAKRIEALLMEHQADLVITTLPAGAQYISAYKEMKSCDIPLYTYITDITAHEEWISEHTDMYFVGGESTKNILISKGIPSHQIIVCGIPVKQPFKNLKLRKLETDKNQKSIKEVLIMGGGLGLIPSSNQLLFELCKQDDIHITMITGKNEKLFHRIRNEFPEIEVIGYTDHVWEYMEQADLVITKSGGITTFEAIYSEAPLYIIKPFLSQEVGNAEYIEHLNIGRVLWKHKEQIVQDVLSLLQNEELLCNMKNNMRQAKDRMDSSSALKVYYQRGTKLCG